MSYWAKVDFFFLNNYTFRDWQLDGDCHTKDTLTHNQGLLSQAMLSGFKWELRESVAGWASSSSLKLHNVLLLHLRYQQVVEETNTAKSTDVDTGAGYADFFCRQTIHLKKVTVKPHLLASRNMFVWLWMITFNLPVFIAGEVLKSWRNKYTAAWIWSRLGIKKCKALRRSHPFTSRSMYRDSITYCCSLC